MDRGIAAYDVCAKMSDPPHRAALFMNDTPLLAILMRIGER